MAHNPADMETARTAATRFKNMLAHIITTTKIQEAEKFGIIKFEGDFIDAPLRVLATSCVTDPTNVHLLILRAESWTKVADVSAPPRLALALLHTILADHQHAQEVA